jgi:hypothetical protein
MIEKDGQIDLDHVDSIIDKNTRAVLLATVGNPLSVAMDPEKFDNLLRIVHKKMMKYGHPIVVIPDTIYEPFRRARGNRISPIQRAMRLKEDEDISVPVIDVSSFSKMMAIPGERVGQMLIWWPQDTFPKERHDFLLTLDNLYSLMLGPVPTDIQCALAELYEGVNSRYPVEEEIAPVAAVLTALKELATSPPKDSLSSQVLESSLSEDQPLPIFPSLVGSMSEGYNYHTRVMNWTKRLANNCRRIVVVMKNALDQHQVELPARKGAVRKAGADAVEKLVRLPRLHDGPRLGLGHAEGLPLRHADPIRIRGTWRRVNPSGEFARGGLPP